MTKQQANTITELQRIAALPYNDNFKKAIVEIRDTYQLTDEQQAVVWYLGEAKKHNTSTWNNIRKYDATYKVTDTDVPIEKDILKVLKMFGLPLNLVMNILVYTIFKEDEYLTSKKMKSQVYLEPRLDRGALQLDINIKGLGVYTTERDWENIWHNEIKKNIENLKQSYFQNSGGQSRSKKRVTLESYEEQMKRYSEWY